MDKQFSDDYYRMTGTFYKKGIKHLYQCCLDII